MKLLSSLLLVSLGALAFAQDSLSGMKDDVISTPTSANTAGPGLMPLVHLFIVIGVLFVLIKYALPKVLNKMTNKLTPTLDGSIRVEASATIGAGGAYVIQVRGKTLLVGASSTGGLSLLCDLTESDRAENAEPAFFEVLDHAVIKPEELPESPDTASERLERLLRGAGR